MSEGHSKTGWLGAPGTQRPCSAVSCVCRPGEHGLGGVWRGGFRWDERAEVRGPLPGGSLRGCQGHRWTRRAGVECLHCCSPALPALLALPKPTTVSTAGRLCLAAGRRGCWERAGAGRAAGQAGHDKQGRTQAGREGGRTGVSGGCRHKEPLSPPARPGEHPSPTAGSARPSGQVSRGR